MPVHRDGKLISPIGTWSGVYFSEELKYAKSLGYTVKPLEGYAFNRGKPFNSFVEDFYIQKSQAKTPFDRLLAKFILNSLYGRTAMKPRNSFIKPLNQMELINLLNKTNVNIEPFLPFLPLNINSRSEVFEDNKGEMKEEKLYHITPLSSPLPEVNNTPLNFKTFSSVPIAAAITAYARMHMYKFKTIPDNPCLYSDTDSVYLQKP